MVAQCLVFYPKRPMRGVIHFGGQNMLSAQLLLKHRDRISQPCQPIGQTAGGMSKNYCTVPVTGAGHKEIRISSNSGLTGIEKGVKAQPRPLLLKAYLKTTMFTKGHLSASIIQMWAD